MSYVKRQLEEISCWIGLQGAIMPLVIDVANSLQVIVESGKASTYAEAYKLYLKGGHIEKKLDYY